MEKASIIFIIFSKEYITRPQNTDVSLTKLKQYFLFFSQILLIALVYLSAKFQFIGIYGLGDNGGGVIVHSLTP